MAAGKMERFDVHTDNWQLYVERLEQYFIVNSVKDELKVPTLITSMGADGYELMVTLCTPEKPAKKTYADLVKVMTAHLQPTPSCLAERHKFRQRKQLKSESIAEYIADLKKMSKYCEFGGWLDESLRDQLVCGLYSETIRQRLFAEGSSLEFNKARNLAIAMESAEINAASVESVRRVGADVTAACNAISWQRRRDAGSQGKPRAAAHRREEASAQTGRRTMTAAGAQSYERQRYQTQSMGHGGAAGVTNAQSKLTPCSACGRIGHASTSCKFVNYVCRVCNQDGHLKKMCPKLRKATVSNNFLEEDVSDSEEGEIEVNFSHLKENKLSSYEPYKMVLEVNKQRLCMEVDTGSAISCISDICYYKMFNDLELFPSNLQLKYYTGQTVGTLGKVKPVVKFNNQSKELDLFVIINGKTNLLGRQWLEELGIPILKTTVYNCKIKQRDSFDLKSFSCRFSKVFEDGLGRYTGGTVTLRVRPDAAPVYQRARPLAYALREPVERELARLESEGVITPVETSDWATPIVPVIKPDGSIRICGDYKISLNKCLEVDRFPLPRVEDLFAKLHGGKKFTKIDLSQAYAQLVLDETSKYTVINTHKGLFRYNRLIYGLASSPGIFQRKLEQMFADLPKVGVFLDDVIITGETEAEHINNLCKVFERLEKYGLKIKKEKCTFLAETVTYLGYVISKKGLHTCPKKVEDITKVAEPKNVTELRSFLGMVMYYAKFVKNISSILTPLYELLKKDRSYVWSETCKKAFNTVKEMLISSEVLAHYTPELPLILTTDASSVGVGAVISHEWPDGTERPVAYASRVLNAAEKGYSQIEKEALAIIYGVRKFHQYLYGRRFTLRTDHKPLVSIFGDKTGIPIMAASRMQRWAIILSGYQYIIEYIPTAQNGADALSRLPPASSDSKEITTKEKSYLNFVQEFLPLTSKDIRKETEKDDILRKVSLYISTGWPNSCDDENLRPYFIRRNELYTEGGCIMWGYRIVIPTSLKEHMLKELHISHMGMVKMKCLARSYMWWPNLDSEIEKNCRECVVCTAEAVAPPKTTPQPWPYHTESWSRLHMDFLGPYEGKMFFVLIDSTSKWIEIFLMTKTNASAVIKILRETFARFGLPKEIVSDNGPPYSSQEMKNFMENNGIKHLFTSPYHPSSNGLAESAVKLCKRAIKKAVRDKYDVEQALQTYLLYYRNTEQATTGETPARMLQRRPLRTRLDLIRNDRSVEDAVQKAQRQQIANAGGRNREKIGMGDDVLLQEFGKGERWSRGKIAKVIGSRHVMVDKGNGQTVKRHLDQVRKQKSILCCPNMFPSGLMSNSTGDESSQAAQTNVTEAPFVVTDPNRLKRIRHPVVRYGDE